MHDSDDLGGILMLKGIPQLLSPDLLSRLARMGAGDQIMITDSSWPSPSSPDRRVIVAADFFEVAAAVLAVMAIADSHEPAVFFMQAPSAPRQVEVHRMMQRLVSDAEQRPVQMAALERATFLERARQASTVVIAQDQRLPTSYLLTKGTPRARHRGGVHQSTDKSPAARPEVEFPVL